MQKDKFDEKDFKEFMEYKKKKEMEEDIESKKQENSKNNEGLTLKKSTLWKAGVGVFVVLFVISLFTGGFGIGKSGSVIGNAIAPSQPTAPSQPSIPTGVASVNAQQLEDDDPFLGEDNAPVVMVEFSDFQCPFCRRFWRDTLPSIKSQYIDTGKVKFVYRDFPLTSIHPGAFPAAEAGECARDSYGEDAFWKMHDKIFEEQDKQGQGTVQFGQTELINWANDLGYDIADCLNSGKFRNEVQNDLNAATSAGGRGTPFFVVGNTPVSGAQPFSSFRALIESQL